METVEEDLRSYEWPVGELLSQAGRLCKAHWQPILTLVLAVHVPLQVAAAYLSPEPVTDTADIAAALRYFMATMVVLTLTLWLGTLAQIGVMHMTRRAIRGELVSWRDGIAFAKQRFWPTLGTSLLMGVIVYLLTFCFIVPGVIWSVYYTFAMAVVALKGLSGKTALDYSKRLVKGNWWTIAGYGFVMGLVMLALIMPLLIGSAVATALLGPSNPMLEAFFSIGAQVAATFVIVAQTLFFLNRDALYGES